MQHDARMRETTRAIYNAVYPGEEWTPVPFELAERRGTVHYRNAAAAAHEARNHLAVKTADQLELI